MRPSPTDATWPPRRRAVRYAAAGCLRAALFLTMLLSVAPDTSNQRDGLAGKLQDLVDDSFKLQVRHVKEGIAGGRLRGAEGVAAASACAAGLRAARDAAAATQAQRPASAAWPADAAFFNPPVNLFEDAKKGDTQIVVPERADGSAGLGRCGCATRRIAISASRRIAIRFPLSRMVGGLQAAGCRLTGCRLKASTSLRCARAGRTGTRRR